MSAPSRESYAAHIRETAPEHADWLIPLLKPAIWIEPTPALADSIPIGASKFGGSPDLPDGVEWPSADGQPLHLIAQFNLAEIAPYDVEGVLPRQGLLSFFFDYFEGWGSEHQPAVFWFPPGQLRRPSPPEGYLGDIEPAPKSFFGRLKSAFTSVSRGTAPPVRVCKLEFRSGWQIPCHEEPEIYFGTQSNANLSGSSPLPDPADPTVGTISRVGEPLDFSIWDQDGGGPFQLLGYPSPIQCSPRVEAVDLTSTDEAMRAALDWVLLFQQHDGPGWHWASGGAIYYLIGRADLLSQRFDRVRVVVQST